MKKQLKRKLRDRIGCGIQHTGYPCNTCFHTIIEEDLGDKLSEDTHEYWLAVLAHRGDYPELPKRPELVKELYNIL